MADYYVDLDGRTAGPFTVEELRQLYLGKTITERTLYSTPQSVEWLPLETIMPLLAAGFRVAPPPPPPPPARRPVARGKRGEVVCLNCHRVGRPGQEVKGSFAVELALWLLFCAPGLIYTIWRLTGKKPCCRHCRSVNVIPSDSPRGLEMLELLN